MRRILSCSVLIYPLCLQLRIWRGCPMFVSMRDVLPWHYSNLVMLVSETVSLGQEDHEPRPVLFAHHPSTKYMLLLFALIWKSIDRNIQTLSDSGLYVGRKVSWTELLSSGMCLDWIGRGALSPLQCYLNEGLCYRTCGRCGLLWVFRVTLIVF